MRREFILVLLGIISISSFSSIISNYVQTDTNKLLLNVVTGSVTWGNFSYWKLSHEGPLIIELTSLEGDADIYVSENERPSFELDRHNFSSATCGLDVVYVPADFQRPIGIGVFGHWSHEVSSYSIKVHLDMDGAEQVLQLLIARAQQGEGASEPADTQSHTGPLSKKMEKNAPTFVKYLSLLDVVFQMFML